jgi:hypothetical protein
MPAVNVYRFEYEILPNFNPWNVYIAAFTNEEAVIHLQTIVKKPINITSSTHICRLDDISGVVRQNVVTSWLATQPKQSKSNPNPVVEKVEEKPKESVVKRFGKK